MSNQIKENQCDNEIYTKGYKDGYTTGKNYAIDDLLSRMSKLLKRCPAHNDSIKCRHLHDNIDCIYCTYEQIKEKMNKINHE